MALPDFFGKITQSLLALGFSTIPLWGKSLFSEEVKYAYLLEPPLVYQVIAASLILVFTPQLFQLAHKVWRAAASGLFYGIYSQQRRKRTSPGILICLALFFLLAGVASLVVGGWQFAFSAVREIKHHERIYRGVLVIRANAEDRGPQIADSLPTIRRILKLFPPDNPEDDSMVLWSARVDAAIELSDALEEQASALEANGKLFQALEFSQASLDVWPENESGKIVKERLDVALHEAAPALTELHRQCLLGNGAPLATDRRAWRFLAGAPENGVAIESLGEDEKKRLAAQLCLEARRTTEPSVFLDEISFAATGDSFPK
jgi:hypothetical protein